MLDATRYFRTEFGAPLPSHTPYCHTFHFYFLNLITPQFTQRPDPSILTAASADPITHPSYLITHVFRMLELHPLIKPPSMLTIFSPYRRV
jgi:hypothetical protein